MTMVESEDMAAPVAEEKTYYMKEIEQVLDRDRSTIRTWESRGWLPASLTFKRDENDWRYWTQAQLDEAVEWLKGRNQGRVDFGKRAKNKTSKRSASS